MKQQLTAVEYIKKRIEEDSDTSFLNIDWNKFDEIINKAKEMEKEQIMDAHFEGSEDYRRQYYNETFKQEK
jgi:hypothetical protein